MNRLFEREKQTRLFQAVMKICTLLRGAGGHALLVGGCVRDALAGMNAEDFDLEVRGLSSEQIRRALEGEFELDTVGASFGILKVRHFAIDISLPRRENKTGSGHRGFLVETDPFLSFREASARRDFTVNAILYDPLTGEQIDPWNGAADLKAGILRHVSGHFAEDPLRVLRAMQFSARFGFSVAPETVGICSRMVQTELPLSRIAAEWEKLLLKGIKPSLGLAFLRDCGWIRYYPEWEAAVRSPERSAALFSALDESVKFRTGNPDADLLLGVSVLCLFSRNDPDPDAAARAAVARITDRKGVADRVLPLLRAFSSVADIDPGSPDPDSVLRRLAAAAGNLDLLFRLCGCGLCAEDLSAEERSRKRGELLRLRRRAEAMNILFRPPERILQGRHLLALGISPGPDMGAFLDRAYEAQLSGAFEDPEGALAWAEKTSGMSGRGKK